MKNKRNSKTPSANTFVPASSSAAPRISGRGAKLADYCDAPPARIHRRTLPFNFGELRVFNRPCVRRGKYEPELGCIHILWPFRILISYTTKRRGVRLASWINEGKLYSYPPTQRKQEPK
jgi:hypothetical protein